MHYAGMAVRHGGAPARWPSAHDLIVIEDAAHAVNAACGHGALGARRRARRLVLSRDQGSGLRRGRRAADSRRRGLSARGRDSAREGDRSHRVSARRARQVHLGRGRQQLRPLRVARGGGASSSSTSCRRSPGARRRRRNGCWPRSRRIDESCSCRRYRAVPAELARVRGSGRSVDARLGDPRAARPKASARPSTMCRCTRRLTRASQPRSSSRVAGHGSRGGLAGALADLRGIHRRRMRRCGRRRAPRCSPRCRSRAMIGVS